MISHPTRAILYNALVLASTLRLTAAKGQRKAASGCICLAQMVCHNDPLLSSSCCCPDSVHLSGRALWTCEVNRNGVRSWAECSYPPPAFPVLKMVSYFAQPSQFAVAVPLAIVTANHDLEAQPLLQHGTNNLTCEALSQCSQLASVQCSTCSKRLCDDHCISRWCCGTYFDCGECSARAQRWRWAYIGITLVLLGTGGGMGGYFATH